MAAEKKDNADSDLYGDLYDDGFTIPLDDDGQASSETFELVLPEDDKMISEPAEKSQTADSASLPAKPSLTSDSSALSYSAQVAKQFSAYQQTPSQERQQRLVLPASGPSAIATHETDRSRADRPIRPSEMKDEG
ncbi:hypothetical protein EDC04DRAFT_2711267 [Pisolithus marmoratus]|nr:hypothetical protein EDC04DRAFT_2711267 [Pisolithus marmoratus]